MGIRELLGHGAARLYPVLRRATCCGLAGSRQGFRDTSGEQVQPMQQGEDPALAPFLQVLDDHVSSHPEQLQPMTTDLVAHLDHLVGAVDVDPDAPLEADDEDEDHATL